MSTPTVDSALRMHRALMLAATLVQRASASVAYTTLADMHPRTAKDLADLTLALDSLGYIDPIRDAPETIHRRPTMRLQTVEDDDDDD